MSNACSVHSRTDVGEKYPGLVVEGNSISLVGLRLLAPVCTCLLLMRLFGVLFGIRLKSMVMPRAFMPVPGPLQSVQRAEFPVLTFKQSVSV